MWKCSKCGEQVEATFDVCWSCGTGKDGSEDPSFRRADDEPASEPSAFVAAEEEAITAHPAPEAKPRQYRKRTAQAQSECPACHGTNLRTDGWAAMEVRVQFGSSWMGPFNSGYGVKCFVCLDCGFLGLYLESADVQALHEQG
jgi:RNA polymerase subunit RPABC4/transcription elongation factor Spt4